MARPNQDLHRFFSHIQINAEAMRSPEFSVEKRPGSLRILFVGDSVTFGTSLVDQPQIFTSIVQHDLLARRPGTEVLNASSNGWAPANELAYLTSRGTYDADLVVSVLNTQDLIQPFENFHANILNPTSDPWSAIGELMTRYVAPKLFKGLEVHDAGSAAHGDPPIESETPNILRTLSEAHRLAEAHHAKYLVIYVPTATTANSGYQARWLKGADLLKDWARTENVPLLDMTDTFAHQPSTEIFLDGTHLKPRGHALVAQAFVSFYSL
jgi:lysophospholipase L1-like esterase